jgi:hypothetical protein
LRQLTADLADGFATLRKTGINAKGRFGKQDFVYVAADDVYLCPAGEQLRVC